MTTEYGDGISQSDDDSEEKSEEKPEEKPYSIKISFLYNGQLGVITDDNGLYYMRSRYYNPEIKRFINQDILTGNIGNSASLNRYSYVEGNPVSYTDPFGLSPFKTLHQQLHKLMFIPGVGKLFALTDAFLYVMEGDWGNALTSDLFVIPGGQYVFGALAACQIIGMYVDELTNDGKRNDQFVQGFLSGLDEYYGWSDMSTGEKIFWVVVIGTTNAYAYSEAQALKISEITDESLRYELYAKLDPVEPAVDLNYTGGVSRVTDFYAGPNGIVKTLEEYDAFIIPECKADFYSGPNGTALTLEDYDAYINSTNDLIPIPNTKPDFYAGPEGIARSLEEYDRFGGEKSIYYEQLNTFSPNKINHIINGSKTSNHMWEILVSDKNWNDIKKIIVKTMESGIEGKYKSVYSKKAIINGHLVEVTYTKLNDGTIKISDAWVNY